MKLSSGRTTRITAWGWPKSPGAVHNCFWIGQSMAIALFDAASCTDRNIFGGCLSCFGLQANCSPQVLAIMGPVA